MARIVIYKCDRCEAEFRPAVAPLVMPIRQTKVEIPLERAGSAFTTSKQLCWPCREHVMNVVKKALEKKN